MTSEDISLGTLQQYCETAAKALLALTTRADVELWYRDHLSKNGKLTWWKKQIGKAPADERREFGQAVNRYAISLTDQFKHHQEKIKLEELKAAIKEEAIDVTLPSRFRQTGGLHPITIWLREIYDVFQAMGFSIFESRHIERDDYNFQMLNIPKDHPARDMQDTFYITDDVVLRTHTSPGQIHVMQENAPGPVQVILPGLCYRNEDITPRSEIQFHQIEGLLVGEHVRFTDLKGILLRFARAIFGENQEIRMRGSYFPFTEPSVEVDILCTLCAGEGCRVCKQTGWLEILGAGLVHPFVLESGGYDPGKVQGIAFGMGVERLILLQHKIDDIRYFFRNDLRFLQQFN